MTYRIFAEINGQNFSMKNLFLAIAFLAAGTSAEAKVRLPHFLTDSMVVQQNSILTIPGIATSGAEVKVTTSWNNKTYNVTADTIGRFTVKANTPSAGGPYRITFDDGDVTELNDILSGEVWMCSGQSNMEMPVMGWGRVLNCEKERSNANYPGIRLLQIKRITSYKPENDAPVNMGGWRCCAPGTVDDFSAAAYFYARELHKTLNIPIGVIDCSWGGTPAESWTSFGSTKEVGGFEAITSFIEENKFDSLAIISGYNAAEERETRALIAAVANANGDIFSPISNKTMPVPHVWDKNGFANFDGSVLLQHIFTVPENFIGKDLELHLGTVDDNDITYFNGVEIGRTSGFQKTRTYKVPAALVKKENTLLVVVTDASGDGGIMGEKSDVILKCGDKTVSLSGNWNYSVISDRKDVPLNPTGPNVPSVLYNGMLYPCHVMPVKGVIWYQGCSNVGRARQYSTLFKRMITDWRKLWGYEMPFYFVQLAGYLTPQLLQPQSEWAALRQAQADALALPKTGMATAIDIGNPTDIHPKNKQEVGRRLALLALKNTYGKKNITDKAPSVKECTFDKGRATIIFNARIEVRDSDVPRGFIIENEDGTFSRGKASMRRGNTVVVETDKAGTPRSVRYDWADYPDGNLYGVTGLPVCPFRTDKL